MSRTSFSNAAFARLVRRLRHTNARYNRIARQIRSRIRHTHHAKRRAYWAGLSIDTSKARTCPAKYISTKPLPVLDRSPVCGPVLDPHTGAELAGMDGNIPSDACMRSLRLVPLIHLNPPEVKCRRRCRRRHSRGSEGRPRVTCPTSLKLHLNVDYMMYCGGAEVPSQSQPEGPVPVPDAPRLAPKQLPEDDCGAEMFESSPSAMNTAKSDPSMPPIGSRVCSGLCMTISSPNLKRKLQDVETEDAALSPQPKRFLKIRLDKPRYT